MPHLPVRICYVPVKSESLWIVTSGCPAPGVSSRKKPTGGISSSLHSLRMSPAGLVQPTLKAKLPPERRSPH